jgi:hypothetical protein
MRERPAVLWELPGPLRQARRSGSWSSARSGASSRADTAAREQKDAVASFRQPPRPSRRRRPGLRAARKRCGSSQARRPPRVPGPSGATRSTMDPARAPDASAAERDFPARQVSLSLVASPGGDPTFFSGLANGTLRSRCRTLPYRPVHSAHRINGNGAAFTRSSVPGIEPAVRGGPRLVYGVMFWLNRKTLSGSYLRFNSTSLWYLPAP